MKRYISCLLVAMILVSATACGAEKDVVNTSEKKEIVEELNLTADSKAATGETVKINSAIYSVLDFNDTSEAECAAKGLIDAPKVLELKNAEGNVIWSQAAYSFVDDYEKAPDTVNPSLWENTRNNHVYGLFEVMEGIYQVRGYDMANLTLIEGDTGWIVFDPLMSVECAQAAMQLVEKNLGKKPVKAVLISHSHVDHYGGIKGIIAEEQVADAGLTIEEQLSGGKIPVIVPEGFTEHAVSENVYAGKAMGRRAGYQYGVFLEEGIQGTLAMGIGMGQSTGTVSFIEPTYEITKTGETLSIDGVLFEFQLTPGTEAPAEMNTWLPQKKALWMAENCTGTLHNLYTLRGAQIRDGLQWSKYLVETVSMYGKEVEVVFQSHNWPHWGNSVVNEYFTDTAAVYRYIHDQTLTYINQGYTSDEISNMIELPEKLAQNWYTRQYYGTIAHNSKAVYQKYMGWYDANPVNLNPLEPSESAKKWVEYLGDTDAVLRKAKEDYDAGEYQWVAEITNVIVFAQPDNTAARFLCADALEQLGYQAESGAWRNAYLTAAKELRERNLTNKSQAAAAGGMLAYLSPSMMFEFMSILLDKKAMSEHDFKINFVFTDMNTTCMVQLKSGAMLVFENVTSKEAELTITCPKNALLYLMQGNKEGAMSAMKIEGNQELFDLICDNLNEFSVSKMADFNIIEP